MQQKWARRAKELKTEEPRQEIASFIGLLIRDIIVLSKVRDTVNNEIQKNASNNASIESYSLVQLYVVDYCKSLIFSVPYI